MGAPWGPIGPPWAPYGAELPPQGATWAPWAPMGRICLQALQGNCSVPRRGVFFPQKTTFLIFRSKYGQKKLRLRGLDLSGEIRSGILCKTPPRMSKMVGWRPISSQIGVILGPLGFRPQLAHPCLTWPMWSLSGGKSGGHKWDINGTFGT